MLEQLKKEPWNIVGVYVDCPAGKSFTVFLLSIEFLKKMQIHFNFENFKIHRTNYLIFSALHIIFYNIRIFLMLHCFWIMQIQNEIKHYKEHYNIQDRGYSYEASIKFHKLFCFSQNVKCFNNIIILCIKIFLWIYFSDPMFLTREETGPLSEKILVCNF